MNEKNTKATETVEIDPGMSVMPEGPGPMDVPTVIPELDSMLAAMPTALPAYQTTVWKNKPSTETPVDAAVMTRVEQRLVDLTTAVNALRDSVSRSVAMDDTVKASIVASSNQKGELELRFTSKTGDRMQVTFFNSENTNHIVMWNSTKSKVEWSI